MKNNKLLVFKKGEFKKVTIESGETAYQVIRREIGNLIQNAYIYTGIGNIQAWVDEEGLLYDLPVSAYIESVRGERILVGTIVFSEEKENEEGEIDIAGMSDEECDKLERTLKADQDPYEPELLILREKI